MNHLTRCASYARHSTDRQNPLSTEDQLEKSRQFAAEHGCQFLENHVYTDQEISGATLERPGLRLLLAAAESRPRPFDTLLIEDASRLSRKQADVLNLCERLSFAGIKIHFISQGIDSGDEKFQLLLLARGMIDQLFLADTAKRVRRGLEGLLRRGLHTGGKCFGYRSRKDPDGTRLEVFKPEAAVVQRIFELYAAGYSLKAIAKKLNEERIPSPQFPKSTLLRSWCPSSIRVILHNTRYLGRIEWNRKHKVRDPKTGRKVVRVREGEKPIRGADEPHLRIVSDELWRAVQARQELVKAVYEKAGNRTGLLRTSEMNSRYLFSGLLKCGVCGANMQVVSGRGRNHDDQTYGCPSNCYRGDVICKNRVRVRRDILEKRLLAGLQEKVLREEVVDYILGRFETQLVKELESIGGEVEQMRKRKAELDLQIQNLTNGLAMGVHSPAVMGEIAKREREVSEICDRLLSSQPQSVQSRIAKLREIAIGRIRELRQYLNSDTAKARAYLLKHVQRIEMQPDGRTYVASGSWDYLGDTGKMPRGRVEQTAPSRKPNTLWFL